MKRIQKLLGLCLIGFLLAVHPISGADIYWMLRLDFPSVFGLADGEEVSDEQIKDRMRSLCFDRLYIYAHCSADYGLDLRVTFYFLNFGSANKRLRDFFEIFAIDNKEQLQRCGHQLLMQKGLDVEKYGVPVFNSNDELLDSDEHKYVIALLMLKKIINGFQGEHSQDAFLSYNASCEIADLPKTYKEILGNIGDGFNIKPAK